MAPRRSDAIVPLFGAVGYCMCWGAFAHVFQCIRSFVLRWGAFAHVVWLRDGLGSLQSCVPRCVFFLSASSVLVLSASYLLSICGHRSRMLNMIAMVANVSPPKT
jgi:hypothetical protein